MSNEGFDKRDIKSSYRSGRDNLGTDFFGKLIEHCVEYKRAAGYFSSTAFAYWAAGLPRIVRDSNIKFRLIISPELSADDLAALTSAVTVDEAGDCANHTVIDEYLRKAIEFVDSPNSKSLRLDLFAWLVKTSRLEIRLAVMTDPYGNAIYHEKFGIFTLPDQHKVAFIGSANESRQAYERNGEYVVTFRDWVKEDVSRVEELDTEFEEAWDQRLPGVTLFAPSVSVLEQIAKLSTGSGGGSPTGEIQPPQPTRPPPWPHQQQAIDMFIQEKRGVLEMATGTGKTRTALEIAIALADKGEINSIIVATDGNDLLRQWQSEMLKLRQIMPSWRTVYRHYERNKERERFTLSPDNSCLVISRDELAPVLRGLSKAQKASVLVIHDEVHGLGSPSKVAALSGLHKECTYVLGLSATPEREYDEEGTQFIESEIGPVIFRFELSDAIRAGILCPFDYVVLEYELTDGDRERIKKVWAMKAARKKEGRPMSDAELAIELSKVYKTAEMKPEVFSTYLQTNPDCLQAAIVFVETKAYGEQVLPLIQAKTTKYKTYYADDEVFHLDKFAKGNLDCLITCHKLSQGIDIPHLMTVILFSSARARLETIQRIGRCLRRDPNNPNKRALVVDFVASDAGQEEGERESSDVARSRWLSELAQVEPEAKNGN